LLTVLKFPAAGQVHHVTGGLELDIQEKIKSVKTLFFEFFRPLLIHLCVECIGITRTHNELVFKRFRQKLILIDQILKRL
jgi:hypothetical protein